MDACVNSVNNKKVESGNTVVGTGLLSAAFFSFVECTFCHVDDSVICFGESKARFWTCKMVFQCTNCLFASVKEVIIDLKLIQGVCIVCVYHRQV
jgi:hypothetical protein